MSPRWYIASCILQLPSQKPKSVISIHVQRNQYEDLRMWREGIIVDEHTSHPSNIKNFDFLYVCCRFISIDLKQTNLGSLKLVPLTKKSNRILFQGFYVGWMIGMFVYNNFLSPKNALMAYLRIVSEVSSRYLVGKRRGGQTNPYIGSLLDDYNPAFEVPMYRLFCSSCKCMILQEWEGYGFVANSSHCGWNGSNERNPLYKSRASPLPLDSTTPFMVFSVTYFSRLHRANFSKLRIDFFIK